MGVKWRREQIKNAIRQLGGGWVTRSQITQYVAAEDREKNGGSSRGLTQSTISSRVCDMIADHELVESTGKVKCPVSGVMKKRVALNGEAENE